MDEEVYVKIETRYKDGEGSTTEQGEACVVFRLLRDKKDLQREIFPAECWALTSTLACFLDPETRRQRITDILHRINHRLHRDYLAALEQHLLPYFHQAAGEAMRRGAKGLTFFADVVVPMPSPLEAVTYGAGDAVQREDKCPICLEDFQCGMELAKMPCTHVFHWRCLSAWLERNPLCPYCRSDLPKESQ